MSGLMYGFFSLPRPVQVATGVSGVGLLAAIGFAMRSWIVVLIILGGLVFVAIVLLVYRFILTRLKKRKADPFERSIRESGGAVPKGVTEVADRARLDEMRTKFEKGVATFREKGKDLYSLPWYAIIGEPGSGKTEAIRHCGIGFPPGLQDELQGTGGTINMDWWFTNHAVILDTAGRLTFGDIESVDNREWTEFLRLLRKHRPNCPINGLIIAIPIDSLVQDDADEIKRKGGRLARQLDLIQSTLGVRFPVVVVVTKSDKLLGFRQFFRTMRDPEMQGQMIGWANPAPPAPLDEPFVPARVDAYLDEIKTALLRRRLRLILDPVHSEDAGARRTDEVDELYAFPEALDRITSRLRRYLEQVFTAGEWSSKPLFLRGIFFTSSMQEGTALDEELADALGVPVESLQESAWAEDRAYFLHDVFLDKVFRESQLVTRATDTNRQQRKRRTIVLGGGLTAAAVLVAMVAWAWSDKDDLEGPSKKWKDVSRAVERYRDGRPIIEFDEEETGQWLYQGGKDFGGETLVNVLALTKNQCGDVPIGLAFRIPAFFLGEGDFSIGRRKQACERLYTRDVTVPLLERAVARLKDESWPEGGGHALAQLVSVHARAASPGPVAEGSSPLAIEPLVRFGTDDGALDGYPGHAEILQGVADWLYVEGQGDSTWPPADAAGLVQQTFILNALARFDAHWSTSPGEEAALLGELAKLRTALDSLRDAENELLEMPCGDTERERLERWATEWGTGTTEGLFPEVARRKRAVDDSLDRLQALGWTPGPNASAAEEWGRAANARGERAKSAYRLIYRAAVRDDTAPFPTTKADIPENAGVIGTRVAESGLDVGERFAATDSQIAEALAGHDEAMLKVEGTGLPRYQVRYGMYAAANALVAPAEESAGAAPPFGATQAALADIEKRVADQTTKIRQNDGIASGKLYEQAREHAVCVAETIGQARLRETAVRRLADKLEAAASRSEVERQVAGEATGDGTLAELPFCTVTRDPGFDADVSAGLFGDWQAVESSGAYPQELADRIASIGGLVGEYAEDYGTYWGSTIFIRLEELERPPSWGAFPERLQDTNSTAVHDVLEKLGEAVTNALDAMPPNIERPDAAERKKILGLDSNSYKEIFQNWRNLSPIPGEAQRSIVSNPAFEDAYFVSGSAHEEDEARYWDALAELGLRRLVDAIETDAGEAWSRLDAIAAFPVRIDPPVHPRDDHHQMSVADVEEAKGLVERLQRSDRAAPNVAGGGAPPMRRKDLQRLVDRLRSPQVTLAPSEEIRNRVARVKLLPNADRPRKATVRMLPAPPGDDSGLKHFDGHWHYVQMFQGGTARTDPRYFGGGVQYRGLGEISFPGEDVSFKFFTARERPEDDVQLRGRRTSRGGSTDPVFPEPWAVHMLLHDYEAESEDGGITWIVMMRLCCANGQERAMWLEIKSEAGEDPILRLEDMKAEQ